MRKWLLALALLINHGMIADRAQAQDNTVTLTVNQADLGIISKGLGSLPYVEVAALMAKLQNQVIDQGKPKKQDQLPVEPPK